MHSDLLSVRRAGVNELDTVLQVLHQRIAWLRARGGDQWSFTQSWPAKLAVALNHGQVWLLTEHDVPVGTVTVDQHADPDFWTPAERADPAFYLSKLAVRPDRAGRGYGLRLLRAAGDIAHRHGGHLLRLDAWKSNPGLHAYYIRRGWQHVRTVDVSHRRSGALFQIAVGPRSDEMAAWLDTTAEGLGQR